MFFRLKVGAVTIQGEMIDTQIAESLLHNCDRTGLFEAFDKSVGECVTVTRIIGAGDEHSDRHFLEYSSDVISNPESFRGKPENGRKLTALRQANILCPC